MMSIRRYLLPLSLLLILCLASVGAVSAGLFDQILEKGKDAVKKETQKEVDKGIDQILRPGHEPQRGKPSPHSQKPAAPPSEDLASREVGSPKLKTALGLPIIAWNPVKQFADGPVLTGSEAREVAKYLDFVDLGSTPELLEKRAGCFVYRYLPQNEIEKYVTPEYMRSISSGNLDGLTKSFDQKNWKGATEFEKRRSREAFLNDYRDRFMAAAVKVPVELIVVEQVRLPEYNFDKNAFVLREKKGPSGQYTNVLVRPSGVADVLRIRLCSESPKHSVTENLPPLWSINCLGC
jgi:hypothetical protein